MLAILVDIYTVGDKLAVLVDSLQCEVGYFS